MSSIVESELLAAPRPRSLAARANHTTARWAMQAAVTRKVAKARKDPSYGVPLDGKRVLITGSSSGIGKAAARQFAARGAHVLLVARRAEELEAVAAEIRAAGGSARALPCDLRDLDAVDALAAEVVAEHGGVDVLVNNAGHSIRRTTLESLERWHDFERTMQINYFSAIRLIRDLVPGMVERRSGHIINVATGGVINDAMPEFCAYGGSKAALSLVSRTLGFELRQHGVHATTLFYPLVRTPMITPTREFDGQPALTTEEAGEWMVLAARTRPVRVASRVSAPVDILNGASPELLNKALRVAFRVSGQALG
ncbi:MAG: SDR family oxidoreductase [Segniliparus sp.]|uniref:SDR family oxidoreductase n=1 Tax=Segniliparus sp. TaxID=2804064 RepID=UPI003F3F572C